VELRLAPCGLGEPEVSYAAGPAGDGLLCARSALAAGPARGHLELRWTDRAALDRDTEIALELLCGDVGDAAGRLQRGRSRALAAAPAYGARAPAGRGRAA
jgi:hypothetical protein